MERISINHKLKCVRVWEDGDQVYFTKKKYGSMDAAYQAAFEYEAKMNPKYRLGRHKPRIKPPCNSQSGFVGVNPYSEIRDSFAGWRATWVQMSGGTRKQRSKKFSFATYGNTALTKAIQYRKEMVEQHMLST